MTRTVGEVRNSSMASAFSASVLESQIVTWIPLASSVFCVSFSIACHILKTMKRLSASAASSVWIN